MFIVMVNIVILVLLLKIGAEDFSVNRAIRRR